MFTVGVCICPEAVGDEEEGRGGEDASRLQAVWESGIKGAQRGCTDTIQRDFVEVYRSILESGWGSTSTETSYGSLVTTEVCVRVGGGGGGGEGMVRDKVSQVCLIRPLSETRRRRRRDRPPPEQ